MDKIADKFKIETTEEEINGHIAQMAIQRKVRPERLKEEMQRDGSLAQFKQQVREQKCVAKLLETAKITEVDAPAPKPHDHKHEHPKHHKKPAEKTAKKQRNREKAPG